MGPRFSSSFKVSPMLEVGVGCCCGQDHCLPGAALDSCCYHDDVGNDVDDRMIVGTTAATI